MIPTETGTRRWGEPADGHGPAAPGPGRSPTQPLEVGRTSRVISPAQRVALAIRDRGCVFPGCERPLAWCEAHHLRHWLHGGPTDLTNLALVCRAHHRAVHEGAGGWPAPPTAGSPPPHPTDNTQDSPPRPDLTPGRAMVALPPRSHSV
jgi:hypothetical protein